uniref:Uncharacterized protein n=1 Tax=Eucampia antarctica TaxID=49252 RepID=A0A7S2QZU0_9STRA|mmetsp:Transcript_10973/g.10488  ORF Transcript_10973/g.10488 Transcript_10973/m.10488 type:complete len:202 (+) Transcript_10973:193-798(+)|eukprot:CAMPEP_0197823952 /NCGR_PEP_ID=MMETSP1437-20131217/1268_1 /TAXON_ID=49252 ORGANISM="Eucampia antarctica, Strain CCMP1452" /NCGR_SAMPLE_ID=MMETSP1437 /ASSEMBLY_ACC=CAM_ASM_001096 /LENGTH=201 /DNA_ID=CAMNT_0043423383 /DNA_START=184 /DNA_END=789 /DNA_ORIENTATION=+
MAYHQQYSTTDELAEIEKQFHTRTSSTVSTPRVRLNVKASQGPRRGSSIFNEPSAMKPTGPYGRPAYLTTRGDELLVEFPGANSDDEETSDEEYQSSHQQTHTSKFREYDSDTDDDEYVSQSGKAGKPVKSGAPLRLGESARIEQLMQDSSQLPGGKDHRPLVGGFAAAAYEAARDLHYSSVEDEDDDAAVPRDRPAPPSI